MTFSEDHTFSPSLANTVRLGFNRIHLTFLPNGLLDPASFNITMPPGSPSGQDFRSSTSRALWGLVDPQASLKAAAIRQSF